MRAPSRKPLGIWLLGLALIPGVVGCTLTHRPDKEVATPEVRTLEIALLDPASKEAARVVTVPVESGTTQVAGVAPLGLQMTITAQHPHGIDLLVQGGTNPPRLQTLRYGDTQTLAAAGGIPPLRLHLSRGTILRQSVPSE